MSMQLLDISYSYKVLKLWNVFFCNYICDWTKCWEMPWIPLYFLFFLRFWMLLWDESQRNSWNTNRHYLPWEWHLPWTDGVNISVQHLPWFCVHELHRSAQRGPLAKCFLFILYWRHLQSSWLSCHSQWKEMNYFIITVLLFSTFLLLQLTALNPSHG